MTGLIVVAAVMLSAVTNGAAKTASKASGPITIGVGTLVIPGVYDANAQYAPGITAALGYIKAHGGWGGRKVNLIKCQSPADPASDTKCYNQFISGHATAMVGTLLNAATVGLPALAKAKIPSFSVPLALADDQSPWEEDTGEGVLASYAAPARYMCAKGYKRVSLVRFDAATEAQAEKEGADPIFSHCGMSVNTVLIPEGTADPAPYIQKAISNNPQFLYFKAPLPAETVVSDLLTAGFPVSRVMLLPAAANSAFFRDPRAVGITILQGYDFPLANNRNRDVHAYLGAMKKYSPHADPLAGLTMPAFQQIMTIWEVSKAIGFKRVTGAAIQKYMRTKAVGRLQLFGARAVSLVHGLPGNKQPFIHFYRLTPELLVNLGWWQGETICSSRASCAKGYGGK